MNKTLIAAMALAACGLAQAQSNVTLYGNVDLSLESMKVTGQSTQTLAYFDRLGVPRLS